jgi:phosphatidylglycerol:prolipoprotein diacylglycerol transferase
MFPRLLITPLFTAHTFGLLLATAYVVAFWWLIREGRREGLEVDALSSLGFWAIGGAILGAKALMIARDFPEYAAAPAELFSLSLLSSAGDFYGGFIGALVACAIFFFRHPQLRFGAQPTSAARRSPSARRLAALGASWRVTTTEDRRSCHGP